MSDLGGVDSTRCHQSTPQGFQTLILDDMIMEPYGVPLGLVLAIKTLIWDSFIEDLLVKHLVSFKGIV